MAMYEHSVTLDISKCRGCTHCLKRCPTEAIRIREGHAVINSERCIDCGECIRICPYKAKKAVCDKLEDFSDYKYKIALPAPNHYGQFDNLDDIDYVLTALLDIGFDDVFEVSRAAEYVSDFTRIYLSQNQTQKKPIISSACPVVARLISIRYPSLCENLLPIMAPVEIAARMAKKEAMINHPELREEDICVLFISPCSAKVSYIRNPIGVEKTEINGALSVSDLYFKLLPAMNKITTPKPLSRSGIIGISWAGTAGEATAIFNEKYLAADGIENIIKVLDEAENENLKNVEFIELNACNAGCVGGSLNVENPYIAKARLHSLRRYLPVARNRVKDQCELDNVLWTTPVEYSPFTPLDSDLQKAMLKMSEIEEIVESLPSLDCGSCGSPTCRALAEDIVKNEATLELCPIKMREKYEKMTHKSENKDS